MEQMLNFNQKVPTESEIVKHKDFDALMRSYRMAHRPDHRRIWYISAASAVAACIALILYFGVFKPTPATDTTLALQNSGITFDTKTLPDQIEPAFPEMDIKAQRFSVSAQKGATIHVPGGTTISIPADAFVDKSGNTVKGNVEVAYREFKTPVDFFLSGMPMHRLKDGELQPVVSAGMFEILAYRGEEPIQLAQTKSIDLEQQSQFSGSAEILYFDKNRKSWTAQGNNELLAENGAVIPAVKSPQQAALDSSSLPVFPRKATPRKAFQPSCDYSSFPELAQYKELMFEVNEKYKVYDDQVFNVRWDKSILRNSSYPGNYELCLEKRDTSVTLIVFPVFSNKSYANAMKLYNEKKQEWLAKLEEQKRKNPETKQNLATNNTNPVDATVATTNESISYGKLKNLGKRHYRVSELGVYQAAVAYEHNQLTLACPKVTDAKGAVLSKLRFFIANRAQNTLYNFGSSNTIAFDKSAVNVMWIVTADKKLAVIKPADFAAAMQKGDRPELKVDLYDPAKGITLLKETMQI
jgi:hypothetical protein